MKVPVGAIRDLAAARGVARAESAVAKASIAKEVSAAPLEVDALLGTAQPRVAALAGVRLGRQADSANPLSIWTELDGSTEKVWVENSGRKVCLGRLQVIPAETPLYHW